MKNKEILVIAPVYIKITKKYGRGLYALRNIKKNELVEASPVVVCKDYSISKDHKLNLYAFKWTKKRFALAFGYGSFFNHSEKKNVTYSVRLKRKTIKFFATKDIKKGQQLFINYGYNPKLYKYMMK